MRSFPFLHFGVALALLLSGAGAQSDAGWDNLDKPSAWSSFGTEEGLPHPKINDITEEPDGTPWVATDAGLAWYDGYLWWTVPLPKGIESPKVQQILPWDSGVAALVGGQVVRASRDGGATVLRGAAVDGQGFPAIGDLGLGELLVFVPDGTQLRIETLEGEALASLPLGRSQTPGLVRDIKGGLRIGPRQGLWSYVKGELSRFDPVPGRRIGGGILGVGETKGLVWTVDGAQRGTLFEESSDGTFEALQLNAGQWLSALDLASDGRAVATFLGKGVALRDEEGQWTLPPFPPAALIEATSLCFRGNGDLWVGTRSGVHLLRREALPLTLNLEAGLAAPGSSTVALAQSPSGDIWSALELGVARHRPEGTIEWIDRALGESIASTTSVACDTEGNVWFVSGSGSYPGALRLSADGFERVGAEQGLDFGAIHKVVIGQQGRVWFLPLPSNLGGDEVQQATWLRGEETGRLAYPEGRPHERYYDLLEHPDGSVWVCTMNGLLRYADLGPDTVPTQINGLSRRRVFCMALEPSGSILVGHQDSGAGLARVSPKGEVTYLDFGVAVDQPYVYDVKVDETGTIWVACAQGLLCDRGRGWTQVSRGTSELLGSTCVLPTEEALYVGTGGGGTSRLAPKSASVQSARVDFEDPVVADGVALLRWKPAFHWGQDRVRPTGNRQRLNGGRWSQWNYTNELTVELNPGSHSLEVELNVGGLTSGPSLGRLDFRVPRPQGRLPVLILAAALLGTSFTLLAAQVRRRRQATRDLVESEAKYRTLVERSPDAILILQGDAVAFMNASCERLLNPRPGATFAELGLAPLTDGSGDEDGHLHCEELELQGPEDSPHYVDATATPVRLEGSQALQVVLRDVTERRASARRQQLLARELDHRVKNNLAGVLALTEQTLARATSVKEVRSTISGRIQAMARAHEALAAGSWDGVRIADLVRLIVSPFAASPERLKAEGPNSVLPPRMGSPLGMVLHELTTNATKYGALSPGGGQVHLRWSVDADQFRLQWIESGGPRLQGEYSQGFGLSILQGVVSHELGGSVEVDPRESGFRIDLSAPI